MGLFNNFPWTNFHELNLDWLIRKVKEIEAAFPEGLIGIPKGGTGADNAAAARRNLEIAGDTIPYYNALPTGDTVQEIINTVWQLAGSADDKFSTFEFFAHVDEISNTLIRGSCTIGEVWATMTTGNTLIAPGSDFIISEVPTTTGIVVICKTAASTGFIRFFGDRTYDMKIQAGIPEEYWRLLVQSGDIIPISSGGTGADNAADAIQNLGIDFSGTVLSVASVGADPTGNVPLKIFDPENIYSSITDLGLSIGNTVSVAWALMPVKSIMIAPSTDFLNSPTVDGTIEIVKLSATVGWIIYHYATGRLSRMEIVSGTPVNSWKTAGTQFDLLWTNPDPADSFAAQSVSISLSNYDMIMVVMNQQTTAATQTSVIIKNSVGTRGRCSNIANYRQFRAFTITATGIDFDSGYTGAPGASASADNTSAIPVYVYGINI